MGNYDGVRWLKCSLSQVRDGLYLTHLISNEGTRWLMKNEGWWGYEEGWGEKKGCACLCEIVEACIIPIVLKFTCARIFRTKH